MHNKGIARISIAFMYAGYSGGDAEVLGNSDVRQFQFGTDLISILYAWENHDNIHFMMNRYIR